MLERMVELTDAELDSVTGGCILIPIEPVLITGNGRPNFNSNAPNTPAAENGLNKGPDENGARVGFPHRNGPVIPV